MTAIATNPLSYNAYITTIGVMMPAPVVNVGGVNQFTDVNLQSIVPQCLNYAELRIQRDLDLLTSQTSNFYTLVAGNNILAIPIDDFLILNTMEVAQMANGQVVNSTPLLPVSKEFIQNVYSGLASAGTPKYFAMYGDGFGTIASSLNNVLLGPTPNYEYPVRVTGNIRLASLYKNAEPGNADTDYTYISTYYPDMLGMASMIYMSAYQRNFSATSDDAPMGQTYEKQYQALRLGAIPEEDRKSFQGSAWSGYSTPTSATQTR